MRGRPHQPRRPHPLHHRCMFFITHSAGACLLANTPSRALAAALPCAPDSAGQEGRRDTNSAGGAGASPGVPQGLPERLTLDQNLLLARVVGPGPDSRGP